jgi:hypothetical protein
LYFAENKKKTAKFVDFKDEPSFCSGRIKDFFAEKQTAML